MRQVSCTRSLARASARVGREIGVRFYRAERGFGFVTADADVYVNSTTLARCDVAELAAGDRVEFQRREKPGARSAIAERIRVCDLIEGNE